MSKDNHLDLGSVKNRFWENKKDKPNSTVCNFRLPLYKDKWLREFLGQPSVEDGGVKSGRLAHFGLDCLFRIAELYEIKHIWEIEGIEE